jgi:hypothetical protein
MSIILAMLPLYSYFIDIEPKQRPISRRRRSPCTGGLQSYPGRTVEVRTDPGPEGYRRCEIYKAGDRVPSPTEGVAELDVAELLQGL